MVTKAGFTVLIVHSISYQRLDEVPVQIVSPEPSMFAKRVKIKEHVKVKTSSQTRYLKKKNITHVR